MSRLTGKDLLHSFDRQVSQYSGEVERFDRAIAAKEREIGAANKRREEAYVALASIYCEDQEKLQKELSAVSREVQCYFDAKAQRRIGVEGDIARCGQLILGVKEDLVAARTSRDDAAQERDVIAKLVEQDLAADKLFQALTRERDEAARKVVAACEECKQIEAEAREKLIPYAENEVFQYLLKRKYGTPEYTAKGWAARIDGWFAEKVGWTANFANYAILSELPKFSESRLKEAQRAEQVLQTRMDLHVQECEGRHKLDDAKLKYERRCHAVGELESRLTQHEIQLGSLSEERNALQENRDPYIKRAKEAVRLTLTGEPVRALRERAERTQDPRDQAYVSQIEAAEAVINSGRVEIKTLRANRDQADGLRERAQKARRKFADDYTGAYDRFDRTVDIDQLLVGYILGQSSERSFWGQIDSRHHDETPQPSYSSSSDSSSFSFGGGDSGGGGTSFGGGDSGGGSSFGGGD